jgi:hypothetical protein
VDVHPRRQIDGRIRQFRLGRLRIARQHALAGPNRLNRPGVIRLTGRPPHPLASGGLSRGRIFGQTTSHGPHGLSRRTDSPGPRLPEPTRHGGHRQHNREAPTKAPADTGARGPLPPGPCRGPPRPRCHRHRRTHSRRLRQIPDQSPRPRHTARGGQSRLAEYRRTGPGGNGCQGVLHPAAHRHTVTLGTSETAG